MSVAMRCLEIIGLKPDLKATLSILRRLGCVHIDDLGAFPGIVARSFEVGRTDTQTQETLTYLLAQVEGLLETFGGEEVRVTGDLPRDLIAEVSARIAELEPVVQSLSSRRENLQAELDALPRYESILHKLLPVIPASAHEMGNISIGVLVNRAHTTVLDMLHKQVLELSSGRAEIVTRDVDEATRAMLIILPEESAGAVEKLLDRGDVTRLRLPEELGEGPPDTALVALRRQLHAISEEIAAINRELDDLAARWRVSLTTWRYAMLDELQTYRVLSNLGETDMSFVLVGWVPAKDVDIVRYKLQDTVGETVLVNELTLTPELLERVPILLENPRPIRPFEGLVRLQSMPRYGSIDPSALMALFMPMFFGMMLGDIGYGAVLLVIVLGLRRKLRTGMLRDLTFALALGSVWSIVFGFLFGELFGTLGEGFGMHAVLFDRASPEHLVSLLVFTLAVGAVHITLGLLLGLWAALKERSRNHLLERAGMLIGLIALFLIVGVVVDYLPAGFMTPAIAVLIVSIVLLGSSMGWLGALMGPIEFIGLIGNVLSYLRIAAIGLASVYLALVANEVAGLVGSVIVGVIIATLIHALNIALGAFSPSIQSLRLHYVEFFRKFYEGGGRPYKPFRSELETIRG